MADGHIPITTSISDKNNHKNNKSNNEEINFEGEAKPAGIKSIFNKFFNNAAEPTLRDTFAEILEEHDNGDMPIESDERILLENILKIGAKTVSDVMVPSADITDIDIDTQLDDIVNIMMKMPHSRYPLYRDNSDNVIGMVHIKDIFKATIEKNAKFSLEEILRDVLFAAPSMRALDLLLEMRLMRLHMALVVDEYGGIDGLVTIEDLVEEIVGEIEDEYDVDDSPKLYLMEDGSYKADARISIEDLEKEFGKFISNDEYDEDIDTLGGLVFHLAGRVPSRGEVIAHSIKPIEFEVIEADPRRIKFIQIRNLANKSADEVTDINKRLIKQKQTNNKNSI